MLFGPDSTAEFLDYNGLDMVVRSHECVEEGFDLPFEGNMEGEPNGGILRQGGREGLVSNDSSVSLAAD